MIIPLPKDAIHKLQLYRLLTAILDDRMLAQKLYFKGGTCAAMLNWLDRFSIDLDFDLLDSSLHPVLRKKLHYIFKKLNLMINQQNQNALQFVLKYQSTDSFRNTLKLSIFDCHITTNSYQPFFLPEINRYAICQTRETMVANKLVSLIDRFEKYQTIAGRDIYDIHYFFTQGYSYKKEVIEERRKKPVLAYLEELKEFIQKHITQTIIDEDLNYLLAYDKFKHLRLLLKPEAIILLQDEITRLKLK